MEFLDLTTLITIAIAVFILLRLRSVLGQRTGHQNPKDYMDRRSRQESPRENQPVTDNVVTLPKRDGREMWRLSRKARQFRKLT